MSSGLVEATLGDFVPALPLTPEGLAYAGLGVLAGLVACFGTRRVVQRRRRPKEMHA